MASGRRQPWFIRATHWADVVLLAILAGSGLQIFAAYPFLGPRGGHYGWFPLQGSPPPAALTLGGWLAGARHWHFAFAWLFVANGIAYAVALVASGEWRQRLFWPPRDARGAWGAVLHDLRLRRGPPPAAGVYNGMQRLAYTAVLGLAVLAVVSGLAIYKPVQLRPLAGALGGYDAARAVHLLVLVALAAFAVVHVVQVALHPRTLADMIAGGRRRAGEER